MRQSIFLLQNGIGFGAVNVKRSPLTGWRVMRQAARILCRNAGNAGIWTQRERVVRSLNNHPPLIGGTKEMRTLITNTPQGNVYAYLKGRGRVWVTRINSLQNKAYVRFNPGEGMRSREHVVKLSDVDFTREWKF